MSNYLRLMGLRTVPDALVDCVVINNYGVPVAFTVVNGDNGLAIFMTARGTVKELTPIDNRDWSPILRLFYADLAYAWHLFYLGAETLTHVPFDALTESEKEAYSAVADADYLASLPEDEERAVMAWRGIKIIIQRNQRATYSVERRGYDQLFNSCLVSFPCETKEDAITLAIRFSCECGYALLFETIGNELTCTFFVRGKVHGKDNVRAFAKE